MTEVTTARNEHGRELLRLWARHPSQGILSRSRVFDDLLDLRSLVRHDQRMLTEIDRRLAAVPGITMVESSWWNATVDELATLIDDSPVAVCGGVQS